MNLKHTRGPWKIGYNDESGPELITGNDDFVATVVQDTGYSDIAFSELSDEEQANARLIASAPEMLEALMTLYKESEPQETESPFFKCEIIPVIEKATGLTIEDL